MIYILVEGPDDVRFFEGVVKPRLDDAVGAGLSQVVSYSGWTKEKLEHFIRGAIRIGGYLLVRDQDQHACVTAAKGAITRRVEGLDPTKIQIVTREIEGWYIAGSDPESLRRHGLHELACDTATKEAVDAHCRNLTRIEWMTESLRTFSHPLAVANSQSFAHLDKVLGL